MHGGFSFNEVLRYVHDLQSQPLHLFNSFWRCGQIFIPVPGDVDIVLDAHTADFPIVFQDTRIYVLIQLR